MKNNYISIYNSNNHFSNFHIFFYLVSFRLLRLFGSGGGTTAAGGATAGGAEALKALAVAALAVAALAAREAVKALATAANVVVVAILGAAVVAEIAAVAARAAALTAARVPVFFVDSFIRKVGGGSDEEGRGAEA